MKSDTEERTGLELIDEAISIVRASIGGGYLYYLIGTLPFLVGWVFFWLEMLRSSFALEYAGPLSMGMALLFFWMKTWQALYSNHLLCSVQGISPPDLSPGHLWTVAHRQFLVQSSGLVLLPVALLIAVPFGWVYAFYQHFTIYSGEHRDRVSSLLSRSMERAGQWSYQNHMVLLLMSFASFVVYLGILILIIFLPQLLKRLTGVQSFFTRASPWQFLKLLASPTLHMVALCFMYIVTDPVMKAVYVLRTFYGESIKTGEDLRTRLRRIRSKVSAAGRRGLILLFAAFLFAGGMTVSMYAQTDRDTSQSRKEVSDRDLDQAIDREISSLEYDWRLPRKESRQEATREKNWLDAFFQDVFETLDSILSWIGDALEQFLEWISDSKSEPTAGGEGFNWSGVSVMKLLLLLFSGGLLALGIYLLINYYTDREMEESEGEASGHGGDEDVDIEEEEVDPRSRSMNHWESLARELVEDEEYRKAVRALFLASLSYLADNRLIEIRRFKSNTTYQKELERHLRDEDERVQAFRDNVRTFEGIWYGQREATPSLFRQFRQNQERLITETGDHDT